MGLGTALAIGGSLIAGKLGSDATKKQAKIQANSIKEAGEIDSAARNKAISQVLEIFGPSLVEFNESMQGSIDLLEQGRISTSDLMTQSAQNVSTITQQGGQAALNAMLGLPSPETVSTAQQPTQQIAQQATQQPVLPQRPKPQNLARGIGTQPAQQQPQALATDNAFAQSQGIGASIDTPMTADQITSNALQNVNWGVDTHPGAQGATPFPEGYNPMTGPQVVDPGAQPSAFQPQQQLTGELMPRDYNFQQQGINIPKGTGAGFMGAVDAVQQGADLGRADLAAGATGALESLNTQSGVARDDIGEGRDFALNQIQQAIQAGRSGTTQGVGSINSGVDRAIGFLNPYMSAGREALDPLMALSGVRGQEAFDAARMNDPAYNLALQESERALGRSAAVTGGIGSGNVKGRFQLNAQQQAAADIDRQLGRFRAITGAGQQAAGTAGGYSTQGGIAAGGLQARGGELEAQQLSRMADVGIRSSEQLSSIAQALGVSESQVLQSLGGNLSNIDVSTGQQIGGMRETAGINAANIIQGTAGQQASIDAGLAQQLANLDQNTLNNIVNSIQSGAGTNLSSQQQLSATLANLGIGAGTSAANTAIGVGQAQAQGVTNPIGNAINTGIGLYASGGLNQTPSTGYTPYSGGYGNTGADYSNVTNKNWGGI